MPFEEYLPPKLSGAIQSFLALYIVVNPSGVASVFLGLTKGMDRSRQRWIALRAAVAGGVALALFALAGTYLFQLFKITGASLQIAGSIFIFGFALALARGKEREYFGQSDAAALEQSPGSIAYSPLAVPLIAGPASITVVMLQSAKSELVLDRTILLGTIGGVAFLTFLSMGRMMRLADRLGPGLTLVLPRVMALILAVIAVQHFVEGTEKVLPRLAWAVRDGLERPRPNPEQEVGIPLPGKTGKQAEPEPEESAPGTDPPPGDEQAPTGAEPPDPLPERRR